MDNLTAKYIESKELERTWKTSRRQRLKEQEQKVWEEFVKEQDVVKVVLKDDPYQFLHQLPEAYMKELMEEELMKAKKDVEQENVEQPNQGEGDFHQKEEVQHSVTFAEDTEREDCDMFHIFDDDKDDPSGPSGPEDEAIASSSPCTVRERESDTSSPILMQERKNQKPVENVSNVIESSIYCAKVKDLRMKIRDEMMAIMLSLECQDVMTKEREMVTRICRRSAEFSTRFNRIYMYKLQRQMQDVKRHTLNSPAFAKHTYFHAQMTRVAALHQHLLHALQVFHKSVEQTACVRESAGILHSLALLAREVTALCGAVPAPPDLHHARLLYDDDMLVSCDKLDEAVCNHSLRVSDFLSTEGSQPSRKNGKGKRRMRPVSKSSKSIPEGRLSMYSLDTLRLNLNCKSSNSNHQSSGTSKMRCSVAKSQNKNTPKCKSPKKSPRNRKPLMRGGKGGASPRNRARLPNDTDITTMVEAVETCTSSRMSREASPHATPRSRRRTATNTPRTNRTPRPARTATSPNTNRNLTTPRTTTPRQKSLRPLSPKAKFRRRSPNQTQIVKALNSISDAHDSESTHIQIITPVSKIKSAKRDKNVGKNFDKVDKNADKADKNADKVDKNAEKADKSTDKLSKGTDSVRDFDSYGNFNSNGPESSGKDFESFKEFDSRKDDSHKGFESVKENSNTTMSKDSMNKDTTSKDTTSLETNEKVVESPKPSSRERDGRKSDRERRLTNAAPASCEVTRLLRQLCSGDTSGSRSDKVSGARNAQLHCVSGGSPRQPSTPQLLRILEETIQKKVPKPMYQPSPQDVDRFRMTFNIPEKTTDHLYQYRNKFVQHMLASSMYANSAVGKPWEMIGSVSEHIIDELLLGCAQEMEIRDIIHNIYNCETK